MGAGYRRFFERTAVEVAMNAAETDVDLGGVNVRTWTYTGTVPAKEMDFDTDNPGRWIVHCHNEYHLEGGMATFFEYTA